MSEIVLNAEIRQENGKANAGRLRRSGRVPAIIYGEIKNPTPVSVDEHTLKMLLREKYSLINISLDGEEHRVIVRDIQYHPVKSNILHIDFLEVKKGQKITMSVPITFEGKPEGVKAGGMLDIVKHEASISVLPKDIPNEIFINIDGLELGDSLRISDINAGSFEMLDDPNEVLCRVEIPRGPATDEEEDEEALEEESAEPEVITARDKEESED